MIIHLSDRPAIKLIEGNWTTEAAVSVDMVSYRIKAFLTVMDSDNCVVVSGGVHENGSNKVIYEGGYIISKKKKHYKKKIFENLNILVCHMSEYLLLNQEYKGEQVSKLKLSMQMQELLTSVRRAMPPEPL